MHNGPAVLIAAAKALQVGIGMILIVISDDKLVAAAFDADQNIVFCLMRFYLMFHGFDLFIYWLMGNYCSRPVDYLSSPACAARSPLFLTEVDLGLCKRWGYNGPVLDAIAIASPPAQRPRTLWASGRYKWGRACRLRFRTSRR